MHAHVLIVGGGPTGMTLALQLQRYGIPFRLIDKRLPEPSGSKALSLNPASLALLADLGVAEALIERGQRAEVINLHYANRPLTRIRFAQLPSPYRFFLMLPQPDTEAVLLQRLQQLGQHVERGVELCHLQSQADGSVHVELAEQGVRSRQRFSHVVGCDGGLSQVRQEMGAQFSGHDYDMHFILADLKVRWDGPLEQGHYFITEQGFAILLPLQAGYHRLVIKVNQRCTPGYKPSLAELQAYLQRYGLGAIELSEPIWLSSAPFYNRRASVLRQGNVFLAGDAAHLFSPIGGFGMNTGIADAFNLGWKLAYSLRGAGNAALLESYVSERDTVIERLLAKTDLSTSLIARLDRHSATDEAHYLPQMANRGFIRQLAIETAGLALRYGEGNAIAEVGSLLPGLPAQVVQPAIGHMQHTVLVYPAEHSSAALKQLRQRLALLETWARCYCLVDPGQTLVSAAASTFVDPQGLLRRTWRMQPGDVLVVRPDLYIGWRGRLDNLGDLDRWLAQCGLLMTRAEAVA